MDKDTTLMNILDELTVALRQINYDLHHQQTFLASTFRNYTNYSSGVNQTINTISAKVEHLRQISSTNQDHIYRLEKEV